MNCVCTYTSWNNGEVMSTKMKKGWSALEGVKGYNEYCKVLVAFCANAEVKEAMKQQQKNWFVVNRKWRADEVERSESNDAMTMIEQVECYEEDWDCIFVSYSLIITITTDYLPQSIEWICAYSSIATIIVGS